jgi:hypothetical protein
VSDPKPSVLFSVVAENRPGFAAMVHNLAISIRSFAGELASAPIVANFVDSASPALTRGLRELDVEINVVARVPGGNPLANKLRMLELHRDHEFDVLIALDCDVVVLGDPQPWVRPDVIAAKPADFDRFSEQEWSSVFSALGIRKPERSLTATATGQRIYPYFNSGVVFVPHGRCAELHQGWARTYSELTAALAADPKLIRPQWQWLAEQAALSLTILRDELPWQPLPTALNFPSHVKLPDGEATDAPIVVHYHGERDERGFLLAAETAALNPAVDRFNRRRAVVLSTPYPGLTRRPALERLRRNVSRRVWERLSEQEWYASGPVKDVRRELKRLAGRVR